jgi:hypothetical protein
VRRLLGSRLRARATVGVAVGGISAARPTFDPVTVIPAFGALQPIAVAPTMLRDSSKCRPSAAIALWSVRDPEPTFWTILSRRYTGLVLARNYPGPHGEPAPRSQRIWLSGRVIAKLFSAKPFRHPIGADFRGDQIRCPDLHCSPLIQNTMFVRIPTTASLPIHWPRLPGLIGSKVY